MFDVPWMSLLGGILVGISALLLMLFTGKTAGISGIINGAIARQQNDRAWRVVFLLAMVAGGALANQLLGGYIPVHYDASLPVIIIAALLVGAGTQIGNGCTSGHGICGIGRLSVRSIVATAVFMITAIMTVFVSSFI